MKSSHLKNILLLGCVALLCLMLGRGIGIRTAVRSGVLSTTVQTLNLNKLDALIKLVAGKYVEEVDEKELIESLIPQVLEQLDPHSVYISAEEMAQTEEDIEGSFSGVGIQFNLREDTIRVVAVVSGGPAEKAGMKAGDCIVSVDDSAFVGNTLSNDKVMKTLRGPKHSSVKLGVVRRGVSQELYFQIERDDIPVNSLDAAYKIGPNIAYLRIGSFSRTTYDEFIGALNKKVRTEHCDRLILDLRDNPGGLMGAAIAISNEFLSKDESILFVKGRAYPYEASKANGKGWFQHLPVVVLMNEYSASASEIVAGALQDNDRAYIVGRRSFGKGLVQQQFPFRDGSATRLTVAHYYIPSGRCIQKPYDKGHFEDYAMEIYHRYEKGEFVSSDSIHVSDTVEYRTKGGRVFYGGGGIMPDFFVPLDNENLDNRYLTDLINGNHLYLFAARYVDEHRETIESEANDKASLCRHLDQQHLCETFQAYARRQGVKALDKDIQAAQTEIRTVLYAYIARNTLGNDAYWEIMQEEDATLKKAIEIIADGVVNVAQTERP